MLSCLIRAAYLHQLSRERVSELIGIVAGLRRQIVELQRRVGPVPCETYHVILAVGGQSQRLTDAHVNPAQHVRHRHVTVDLPRENFRKTKPKPKLRCYGTGKKLW